ncbi:hypothetical protein JQ557_05870 [Bradyrhizobium sp. U87765 SZCCT0131]|uniref:hypothetical protein n=1 Tax=unclassified Bradyrhizobium TaxID=2631580 RepID=UPI001BA57449|nr:MULTISPECIES: hypothetical protein [unclassified Bradyrhizobium]MBR1217504.1 hypothetical protein [Bradyrhizobium sp. U87765 SZCCT0131]MBR1264898.1 hypothetical protein [Bradyrhizobium sp. U87765 SZCCT0134]MBR1304880.1 hypothetical protein [Bradyrhizobium sp. U87765 SZCCT0110]MBR1320667.1 hypothetical protein [Bradyrhizobium sp. U87765 SZCCT0109]MBR1349087.1 hypothetical protein [Bradyrhizobium sp. U87765 SZCCT0048]
MKEISALILIALLGWGAWSIDSSEDSFETACVAKGGTVVSKPFVLSGGAAREGIFGRSRSCEVGK